MKGNEYSCILHALSHPFRITLNEDHLRTRVDVETDEGEAHVVRTESFFSDLVSPQLGDLFEDRLESTDRRHGFLKQIGEGGVGEHQGFRGHRRPELFKKELAESEFGGSKIPVNDRVPVRIVVADRVLLFHR